MNKIKIKVLITIAGIVFGTTVIMGISLFVGDYWYIPLILGAIWDLGFIVFAGITLRCPYCGKGLPLYFMDCCPHCGLDFNEDR